MLLVCVHFWGKKLSYDLNSYYWRVVMTNKDNMMINIMIVKAVIIKNVPATCICKSLLFLSEKQEIPKNITGKTSKLHRYVMFIHVYYF